MITLKKIVFPVFLLVISISFFPVQSEAQVSKLYACAEGDITNCTADTAVWRPVAINSQGVLQSNLSANINLDTASLALVDRDGDEWDINPDQEGKVIIKNNGTGESIPVQTLNNDTDVVLNAFGGDTISAIGNALRVTESRPQRVLFDSGSGETVAVSNFSLQTTSPKKDERYNTGSILSAGETTQIDVGFAPEIVWITPESGDIHYSTTGDTVDKFDDFIPSGSKFPEEDAPSQTFNILADPDNSNSVTVYIRALQ
jgi:hypothetical protein